MIFLIIWFAPEALTLICKFGAGDKTRSELTVRKYCVYYEEYLTNECNETAEGKFGALSTFDEISGKCTVYHHTKHFHAVVACFCRTDGCNTLESIVSLVRNSRHHPEALPSIPGLWHENPGFSAINRRDIMRCLANKQQVTQLMDYSFTINQVYLAVVVAVPIALFFLLACYHNIFSRKKDKSKMTIKRRHDETEGTSESISK